MARKSRKYPQTEAITPKTVSYAAWGYARISIDGERSEDSIESQTAIIQDFVNDKTDIELREVISDLGFSGTNFDRPGIEKLLDGIKRGDVQCVIVKDLSRLGRTYIEVGELLFDILPAHHVRFISVNDFYDSFADDAVRKKLLILFKNLVNHMYSKDLGKKIRSAHCAKKQRGELLGISPYGYKRSDDGAILVPDDDAADVVKRIFDLRLAGESGSGIAKRLTREGVLSPQQRRYQLGRATHEKFSGRIVWTTGMVNNLLKSEVYIGTLVQGKYDCDGKQHTRAPKEKWIRHEGMHPAIVSKEQFDAVQTLMQHNSEKYEHSKAGSGAENSYTGKFFCSRCGKAIVRCNGGKPWRIRYYYCCKFCDIDLKNELGLTRTSKITLDAVDAAVMASLQKQLDSQIDIDRFVERVSKTKSLDFRKSEFTHDKEKFENKLYEADKTLSAAYAHHLNDLLNAREFELVRTKVERDKKEAAAGLALVESELKKYGDLSEKHSQWRKIYDQFRAETKPTKQLVQALISKIVLTPLTNDLEIVFNYEDGLEEYRQILKESEAGFNG